MKIFFSRYNDNPSKIYFVIENDSESYLKGSINSITYSKIDTMINNIIIAVIRITIGKYSVSILKKLNPVIQIGNAITETNIKFKNRLDAAVIWFIRTFFVYE